MQSDVEERLMKLKYDYLKEQLGELQAKVKKYESGQEISEKEFLKDLSEQIKGILDLDDDDSANGDKKRSTTEEYKRSNDEAEENEVSMNDISTKEACRNPLILGLTFSYLNIRDQTTCRLVNRIWKDVVDSQMIREGRCQIGFSVGPNRKKMLYRDGIFHKKEGESITKWSLNKFNEMIEKSVRFPVSNFSIKDGDLSSAPVQKFFNILGTSISKLEFLGWRGSSKSDPDFQKRNKKTLKTILMDQAPNVEELTVACVDVGSWDESDGLHLPSLKCLHLSAGNHPTLDVTEREILRVAPNLTQIQSDNMAVYTSPLLEYNKFGLVTDFQMCYSVRDKEAYELFTRAQPRLKKLRVFCYYHAYHERDFAADIAAFLQKLLISSQASLENLRIHGRIECFQGSQFEMPKLPKLRSLTLGGLAMSWTDPPPLPPFNISNMGDTFTNLQHLYLGDVFNTQVMLSNIQNGVLPTVTHLQICENTRKDVLLQLQRLCPNFRKLTLTSSDSPNRIIQDICAVFQNLEDLQLNIRLGNKMDSMDSAFTGLSKEDCRRSPEDSERVFKLQERIMGVEKLRVSTWIGSLTGLKSLEIHIYSMNLQDGSCTPPLTKLSYIYGFQMMPQLRVTISYNPDRTNHNLKTALESIEPYVQVRASRIDPF